MKYNLSPMRTNGHFYLQCKEFIQKYIEEVISEFGDNHELGVLKQDEEEVAEKPWETSKVKIDLQRDDFPKRIEIIKANILFIPKAGISQYE